MGSLSPALAPRSVVVIGASRQRGKIGSEILHNLIASGFTGRLDVVHPTAASIEGIACARRVTDLADPVDLAVIAVPAPAVAAAVDDCLAKPVQAIVVISAGFSETDEAGRAREAALVEKVRAAGVRLIGPNCMGVLNTAPDVRLNATFSPVFPPAGRVAMSTQSGALGLAILDYAERLHLGISSFASIGNKADVSANDLIKYWETDAGTDVILLYVESFGNPLAFRTIARRVSRSKPIIAVKSGRTRPGARAASSHTGALASSDAAVEALCEHAGVVRTATLEEMFDVTKVLATQPPPAGRRVAIVTNAGGPGILAADACVARGLDVPLLSPASQTALRAFLPPTAAVANPVDMIASASAEQYEQALTTVLADPAIDSVMVIFIPPLVTGGDEVAGAIRRAAVTQPAKPVLAIFMSTQPAASLLRPIPRFTFPEAAATALARAAWYGEWRRAGDGTPAVFSDIDAPTARGVVDRALARGGGWLDLGDATALMTAAGIVQPASSTVWSEDEAVATAERLGYPVVLKAQGPSLLHKTEADAVRLGLVSADGVRSAWRELASRLGTAMSSAMLQQMVVGGVEMLIGAVHDPQFGPLVVCATGGTLTELVADRQVRLTPLTREDAATMVDRLRGRALLDGYRGTAAVDRAALEDALLRLSALVGLCPEIQELDVNPLAVITSGVRALDVRVRVGPLQKGRPR